MNHNSDLRFIKNINGEFLILIFDKVEDSLKIINDRFTSIPFYYNYNKEISANFANLWGQLVLVNYKVILEYITFVHSLKIISSLQDINLIPVYSEDSDYIKGLIEHGVPRNSFLSKLSIRNVNAVPLFNKAKKIIKYNRFTRYKFSEFNYLLFQNYNEHNIDYFNKKRSVLVLPLDINNFIIKNRNISINTPDKILIPIKRNVNKMVLKISDVADQFDLSFSDSQLIYLENITSNIFLETYILMKSMESNVLKWKGEKIFLGCNSSHQTRMFTLLMKNRGVEINGFMHGNPLAHELDWVSWLDLPFADNFYTFTDHSAKAFRDTAKRFPAPNMNNCKIIGANTSIFQPYKVNKYAGVRKKVSKKIMIVTCPYTYENQALPHFVPNLVKLHFEYKLVELLYNAGYSVLYQKHPGDYFRDKNISFFPKAEIIYQPFEESMALADAFIFYHTRTSTLGPALCTNKPIIILDGGWEPINPNMKLILENRCSIFSVIINNDNLYEFDLGKIETALHDEEKCNNDEFINLFL
ncbi:MAG: hypothetical protein IH852_09405 [Bacteroidetes bacterium]|nr:hypothetical protein [Bacteroidota bacterium]